MRSKALGVALALALVSSACVSGGETVQGDLAAAIAAASPGAVLTLGSERYAGPLVVDKPLTIIGAAGSVIVGEDAGPVITVIDTRDVTIRDIAIEGGRSGVLVVRSEGVTLDGVRVAQALWHGIVAQDSSIEVIDCHVSGLRAPQPQGVEIINSDSRPPSLVSGCRIEGPVFEGIVSHVSHVTFENNEVVGSMARGVVITEMSDGLMEGNRVSAAQGNAYFCGDMSICSIVDNRVDGVSAGEDHRSAGGHGVVIHYHSSAFVDGLIAAGVDGDLVLLMLDSRLLDEAPPAP